MLTVNMLGIEIEMEVPGGELMSWLLESKGTYSTSDLLVMMASNESGIFVDIGANIGWHSIAGYYHFSKVIAFEPYSKNRQILERNLAHNTCHTVTIASNAISDKKSTGTLYLDETNCGNNTVDAINTSIFGDTEEIVTTDLDSYFNENEISTSNVSCIKIDIQGYEIKALHGMQEIIEKSKPVIIIEYDPRMIMNSGNSVFELFSFIELNNYLPFAIHELSNPLAKLDTVIQPLSFDKLFELTGELMELVTHWDLALIHKDDRLLRGSDES